MMNAVLRSCSHLKEIKLGSISQLASSFHTSCSLDLRKVYPFDAKKVKVEKSYYRSGDLEGPKVIDLSQPRPEFRNSKELEKANELVKRVFSLDFAPRKCTTEVLSKEMIQLVQRHPADNYNSIETKIAYLTSRIRRFQALNYSFNRGNRCWLMKKLIKEYIEKRQKYLRILRKTDGERFDWLTETLKLDYIPHPDFKFRKTNKDRIRFLTQSYCEQIRMTKLQEYKERLKTQQNIFAKEREEKLKFIAEEEKALGLTDAVPLPLESEHMKTKEPPIESTLLQIARKSSNTEDTVLKSRPPEYPKADYLTGPPYGRK